MVNIYYIKSDLVNLIKYFKHRPVLFNFSQASNQNSYFISHYNSKFKVFGMSNY
jgi:hypothetical protein